MPKKSYQRTDLEEIWSIFHQIIVVVSHIVFRIPDNPLPPKNIRYYVQVPQRQFWGEDLFLKYDKNKNV